jgi:hypothetical protein
MLMIVLVQDMLDSIRLCILDVRDLLVCRYVVVKVISCVQTGNERVGVCMSHEHRDWQKQFTLDLSFPYTHTLLTL